MKLYYYPLSRYCQKVLLALYEKEVAFTPVVLYPGSADGRAELRKLTPIGKVPLLVLDDGWKIPESTIIVEYLDGHGTRLIPEDRDLARQTRFYDRIGDLYVSEAFSTITRESEPPERVAAAREQLDRLLTGIDRHVEKRTWIMGDSFTLADCSLIPTLAAMGTVYSLDRLPNLSAYLARALQRPSVARMRRELDAFTAKAAS